ncbi:MAG: cysteine desulfurase [Bacteroidetes bacterium]|nr:cysteine desulfurase [Bacteroidota bacterium]MBL6943613.1 cysteine desulfurase [Bacteroidales bacterium]
MAFPVTQIRSDFPILSQKVNNKPLVYFDNAATTQKPLAVINRISDYYKTENSNVHRGNHYLSQIASDHFENARKYVAGFINATSEKEIIFTKGTTDSINLVASTIAEWVKPNDNIIITAMEHHSNLVPWQQLCIKQKANLKVVPIDYDGNLDMDAMKKMITPSTKLLAVTHISNVLGTINPIKEIVNIAHKHGVPVLVDGAQALAHISVDVNNLDCDFYTFSAHKAYGPMGMGVLYGKSVWLEQLPPYQYGGEMIKNVTFEKTTFNNIPYKYEAGTPDVAGALGLETALNYIKKIGINNIREYEDQLLAYATEKITEIDGVRIVGKAKDKTAVLSFVINGIHPYDLGTLLDQMGVAVRTGTHCAQPLMEYFGVSGTIRTSFGLYNTQQEVDVFIDALKKAVNMLS